MLFIPCRIEEVQARRAQGAERVGGGSKIRSSKRPGHRTLAPSPLNDAPAGMSAKIFRIQIIIIENTPREGGLGIVTAPAKEGSP